MRLYRSLLASFRPQALALSRRDFLKGVGSAALWSENAIGRGISFRRASAARVVIVGAGFSGLSCAYELRSAGHDVRVVEARNRVSGRVLTFRDWIPGKTVEGGGELIGSNHPTWLAFAKTFGLTFRPIGEDDISKRPVVLNGQPLDQAQKMALFEGMDRVVGALTKEAIQVDADRPWLTPGAAEIDARSLGAFIDQQSPDKLTLAALTAELGSDNGAPLHRQSLLGMLALQRIPVKLTRSRRGGSSCGILHEKVSVRKHRHVGIE